jgi:hypothetical protein
MMKHLTFMVLAVFCLAGCGGGGGGSDICNALDACGVGGADCETTFEALILPGGCEEAIIAADCTDHQQETPSYTDLCFPPCGADSALCTGDIITACYQGRTMTSNCPGVCELAGRTYSGVCADEYQGQQSETGMDVCWCE